MQQDVEGLKGFFSGFFKLETGMWAGFLAGWQGLPFNEYHEGWLPRLAFGVTFLTKLPLKVAASMVFAIAKYTFDEGPDLIQSVTPFAGKPEPFEAALDFKKSTAGDVAAKNEAKEIMGKSANGYCCNNF
jgi:lycopene beta-cyclase